ncbi:unnamed protein product [Sphagnum compactum]
MRDESRSPGHHRRHPDVSENRSGLAMGLSVATGSRAESFRTSQQYRDTPMGEEHAQQKSRPRLLSDFGKPETSMEHVRPLIGADVDSSFLEDEHVENEQSSDMMDTDMDVKRHVSMAEDESEDGIGCLDVNGVQEGHFGSQSKEMPVHLKSYFGSAECIERANQMYECNRMVLRERFTREQDGPVPSIIYCDGEVLDVVMDVRPMEICVSSSSKICRFLSDQKVVEYRVKKRYLKEYRRLRRFWEDNLASTGNRRSGDQLHHPRPSLLSDFSKTESQSISPRSSRQYQNLSDSGHGNKILRGGTPTTTSFLSDAVRSEEEYNQVLLTLLQSDRNDVSSRWMSTLAKIPRMDAFSYFPSIATLSPNHYIDTNRFDPDPLNTLKVFSCKQVLQSPISPSHYSCMMLSCGSFDRMTSGISAFSSEERRDFIEKYLQFPKRFDLIAKSLSRRCVSEVIQFYYENKKELNFKAWQRLPNVGKKKKPGLSRYEFSPPVSEEYRMERQEDAGKIELVMSEKNGNKMGTKSVKRTPVQSPLNESGVVGSSSDQDALFSSVETGFETRFSYLTERPLLQYEDVTGHQKLRVMHWSPMEKIVLVDGIIKHGLDYVKLVETLSVYRQQLKDLETTHAHGKRRRKTLKGVPFASQASSTVGGGLKGDFTTSLVSSLKSFIYEPTRFDRPKVHQNSDLEIQSFYDIFKDVYNLDRFTSGSGFPQTPRPTSRFPESLLRSRKMSLPNLPTFHFDVSPSTQLMSNLISAAEMFRGGAVSPNRKFSLSSVTTSFDTISQVSSLLAEEKNKKTDLMTKEDDVIYVQDHTEDST